MKQFKACVLAGGEGQRLRPLTSGQPKPMVRLFDRPVLEHILSLLEKNGVRECALTLMYLPHVITDYFGDRYGSMRLFAKMEDKPLGTAGGVGALSDFFKDGDFLVISGDAVCDFDLRAAFQYHTDNEADITVLTYRHPEPLEYGLVLVDEEGRINRFVEKPAWDQVFSNLINTGIYILSPRVLSMIPEGKPFDFARDLFPLVMKSGGKLMGYECAGYWCDMGDTVAYLQCAKDRLSGKLKLGIDLPEQEKGVFASRVPEGVRIVPPVYLSDKAEIAPHTVVGPYAILHDGARLEEGARVKNSICAGRIGPSCEVDGAVVCEGAAVGAGSVLSAGSVIGSGASIGRGCYVSDDVRVWNGAVVEEGSVVDETVTGDTKQVGRGIDHGVYAKPSVKDCLGFAKACASAFGKRGGVGAAPGLPGRDMLLAAFEAGAMEGGCHVIEHDASFAASACLLSVQYSCLFSAYFDTDADERVRLRFFDPMGLPLDAEQSKKLLLARFRQSADHGTDGGELLKILGADRLYTCRTALDAGERLSGKASVKGSGPSADALRAALAMSGIEIGADADIAFTPSKDGMRFETADEQGNRYSEEQSLLLVLLASYLNGTEVAALPYDAPSGADDLAADLGKTLLRRGRDTGADRLYARTREWQWASSGVLAILACLSRRGVTLASLASRLPDYSVTSAEVSLRTDRADVMAKLVSNLGFDKAELVEGVKLCVDGGWVRIAPTAVKKSLRVVSEGCSMEVAREICREFCEKIEHLDGDASEA